MTTLLIAGSPTTPSRSTRLLNYVGDSLQQLGHSTELLLVRDLPAQALLHADFSNIDVQVARARIAQAEAIVIATPIYKASFCGLLKVFLYLLPQDALAGKLVLPLATGGSQSHMLALDYALRPVLHALAARHILPSIFATDLQVHANSQSELILDETIAQRIRDGVASLSLNIHRMQSDGTCRFAPVHFSQVQFSA